MNEDPSASGGYKILTPLNPGTGSRALLALHCAGTERRPIVLLPIPQSVLDDPELFARLEKETRRAALLEHPGILRVFGLFQSPVGLCRAVEYAHGETLRALLNMTGRIPAPIAVRLMSGVAAGVHYAHLAGNEDGSPLVHGDLRPETIMVSNDGTARVSGYGALSVAPREPSGGRRVVGRRKYAAPEQVMGGRSAMAPTTDVFLLAVTLYEMLTGEIPFQASNDPESAVIAQPIPVDRAEIPEPLRAVITKATAKLSRDRYPSVLDLRIALEDAMGSGASDDDVQNWLLPLLAADPRQAALSAAIAEAMESPDNIAPYVRAPSLVPQPIAPAAPVQPQAQVQAAVPAPAPAQPEPPVQAQVSAPVQPQAQVTVQASQIPASAAQPQTFQVQGALPPQALGMLPTQPPTPVQIQVTLPAQALQQPLPPMPAPESKSPWGKIAAVLLAAAALSGAYFFGQRTTSGTSDAAGDAKPSEGTVLVQPAPEGAASASPDGAPLSPSAPASEESAAPAGGKEPASGSSAPSPDETSAAAPPASSPSAEAADTDEEQGPERRAAKKKKKKKARAANGRRSAAKSQAAPSAKDPSPALNDEEDEDDEGEEEEAPEAQASAPAPSQSAPSAPEAPTSPAISGRALPDSKADEDDSLEAELEAALVSASAMEKQPSHLDRPHRSQSAEETPEADDMTPQLQLFTIPQVNVRIKGGKALGQTPLKVPLAPGSYTLELYDPDNRIQTERTISVADRGISKIDITLGIGGIYVTAPEGASIIIDGKRWGFAPISKAIELYEGRHTLQVNIGGEERSQTFQLNRNDMLNFNFGSGGAGFRR